MSGHGLVVRFDALEEMEAQLTAAQEDILARVEDTFARVDQELAGWSTGTASRAAQLERQAQLREGARRLCAALADVREALGRVRADAHDTEVRNVAVIG